MPVTKNKTTTVGTNLNSSTNAGQKTNQIPSISGGKTPLDSLMGQKLTGPKISTVKR